MRPDFIARNRPVALDYMPVGVSAPARTTPARTPIQARQTEAELEALRAANEAEGRSLKVLSSQSPPVKPVVVPTQ
jgi:hypothetical protein